MRFNLAVYIYGRQIRSCHPCDNTTLGALLERFDQSHPKEKSQGHILEDQSPGSSLGMVHLSMSKIKIMRRPVNSKSWRKLEFGPIHSNAHNVLTFPSSLTPCISTLALLTTSIKFRGLRLRSGPTAFVCAPYSYKPFLSAHY